MESKFKVGDRVRIIHQANEEYAPVGSVTEVVDVDGDGFYGNHNGKRRYYWDNEAEAELELVPIEKTYEPLPDTKLTNPKDAIGSTKLGMSFVPDTLKVYAALAFTEGATKYGSYNWRVSGVRASIYKSAAERHLAKYWNGEWADPVTGVPHLASVIACAAIILDANVAGKLTDDRPPKIDIGSLIDNLEPAVKHLMDLHKDKAPHHHTELAL